MKLNPLFASVVLSVSAFAVFPLQARAAMPQFKRIMFVIFESTDYQAALAQPTFAKIARDGALLTNVHAETHPSQGNYLALISGSTQGVNSDRPVNLSVPHVGDLLEAKGKSWKIYLESFPGGCFIGGNFGTSVRKHNPFISFLNIQNNAERCSKHLVDAHQLDTDSQAGQLPDYSIYIPDMNNDGHDTGVAFADRWISSTFMSKLQDPHFMQDLLVVFTFDEGCTHGSNQIYTAFYGASVSPGTTFAGAADHTTLLKLVEDQLGLGNLGQADATGGAITGIWK